MDSATNLQPRNRISGLLAVALAIALLLPAGALAQARLLVQMIVDGDTDGDGKLSRAEAPVSVLAFFDRADADGDSLIDDFEAKAWDAAKLAGPRVRRPAGAEAGSAPGGGEAGGEVGTALGLIQELDRNGDEQLSLEEFPLAHRSAFGTLDLDKNGYVDLIDAQKIDSGELARQRAAERQRGGGGRSVVRTVELMDTNGDGVLQKREAPVQLQQQWEQFDRNGDGAIDMREARTPTDPTPGS